jgi:hypothetical protein
MKAQNRVLIFGFALSDFFKSANLQKTFSTIGAR